MPTLQLPGSARLAVPIREIGASGIDQRAATWAAPDPLTMVVDPWAPPTATPLLARAVLSPWAAPAASARIDMAPPVALTAQLLAPPHPNAVPISTVEPTHAVRLPDLVALARVSGVAPTERRGRRSSVPSKPHPGSASPMAPIDATPLRLPRPSIADLVRSDEQAAGVVAVDRSGVSRRLLAAVAVGAGMCAAAAALLSTLLSTLL